MLNVWIFLLSKGVYLKKPVTQRRITEKQTTANRISAFFFHHVFNAVMLQWLLSVWKIKPNTTGTPPQVKARNLMGGETEAQLGRRILWANHPQCTAVCIDLTYCINACHLQSSQSCHAHEMADKTATWCGLNLQLRHIVRGRQENMWSTLAQSHRWCLV